MKKLFLGTFLVAILVAIAYFQTERDASHQAEAFNKGRATGVKDAGIAQSEIDSLTDQLELERAGRAERRAAIADSMAERDSLLAQAVDSLSEKIVSQGGEIARLEEQLADSTRGKTDSTGKKTSGSKASHKDILAHYRLAMARLPADLSEYERRVSVTELRTETAAKFRITVARLNEIREIYKLTY